MEKRFDNDYGKVYSETGEFMFSYFECGINADMTDVDKNTLVNAREDFLFEQRQEAELQQQGLI